MPGFGTTNFEAFLLPSLTTSSRHSLAVSEATATPSGLGSGVLWKKFSDYDYVVSPPVFPRNTVLAVPKIQLGGCVSRLPLRQLRIKKPPSTATASRSLFRQVAQTSTRSRPAGPNSNVRTGTKLPRNTGPRNPTYIVPFFTATPSMSMPVFLAWNCKKRTYYFVRFQELPQIDSMLRHQPAGGIKSNPIQPVAFSMRLNTS